MWMGVEVFIKKLACDRERYAGTLHLCMILKARKGPSNAPGDHENMQSIRFGAAEPQPALKEYISSYRSKNRTACR